MKPFKFIINSDDYEIIRYAFSFLTNSTEFLYEGINDERDYKLDLSIPYGIVKFTYMSTEFQIEHKQYPEIKALQNNTTKHVELIVSIHCENSSQAFELFSNFVKEAFDYCKDKKDTHVSIHSFMPNSGCWTKFSNLPKRNLDTIYINEKEKEKIICDIKKFYENKDKYI